MHHGCKPFWGSEFCSGAEFVEVLPEKIQTKNAIKMCSIPFYSSCKKTILKYFGLIIV